MYDYNNDTRTYIGTDETKRTQIDADRLYQQYAQAAQPYLNQQTGAVQGAQQNAQNYLTALNNGQASVAQARQNYAVNSALQGIPAQNGAGVYGMYKAGAGNLGNTLDQSAMGRAAETNMGNQMYGATQLGAAGQYGGQADFAMNQLQAAQNAAAQSENARQGNDKASYGQGMQAASSAMGAIGTMAAMASDANSKVIIDNLTKENQALKAQSGQPNDTFHQFYNSAAPKPTGPTNMDGQPVAPFRPDPQKLAAWQAEKQRMADNGERVYWENQQIFNPEAAEPTGLEKIRQLIAPGTTAQPDPSAVLPAQRGPNHPGARERGSVRAGHDQFIRGYNTQPKPPMVMATDMPGESQALDETRVAMPAVRVSNAGPSPEDMFSSQYQTTSSDARSKEIIDMQAAQLAQKDARIAKLASKIAPTSAQYLKGPNGETTFMDDQGAGHTDARMQPSYEHRGAVVNATGGYGEDGRFYIEEKPIASPSPERMTAEYTIGPNGERFFMDDQGRPHHGQRDVAPGSRVSVEAMRGPEGWYSVPQPEAMPETGERMYNAPTGTMIPGSFAVGPGGTSTFRDTGGRPNTLQIPEQSGEVVRNPYVTASGRPTSYDIPSPMQEPRFVDLTGDPEIAEGGLSDAYAKDFVPGDEYVPSKADRLQELYGAGPQLPNAGNPIPGDEYVSSDKSVKKTATPRLIHELSKRGINVPGGDPMGGAIDQMMDKTKPHAFKYKDSADMDHVGALPHNRVRPGIVLQDLEKSPLGATLVLNTPKGKMFDVPSMTGANTAMIARLNARLRKLEGKRHG